MLKLSLAMIAGLVVIFFATLGLTHEWYDPACCSGMDCAPIPRHTVEVTPDGIRVTLDPTTHFMAKGEITRLFPWDKVRVSQDKDYHACVIPTGDGVLRCLYAPMQGA